MKTVEILVKKTAIETTSEDWRVLTEAAAALSDYCDNVESCDNCFFKNTCDACGGKSPALVLRMILGDLDD